MRVGRVIREHLREHILLALNGIDGHMANGFILSELISTRGIVNSIELVGEEVDWLDRQGLVAKELISGWMFTVRLTSKGQAVAEGQFSVAGVHRTPE